MISHFQLLLHGLHKDQQHNKLKINHTQKHQKNKHEDTQQRYYGTQECSKRPSRLAQYTVTMHQKENLRY